MLITNICNNLDVVMFLREVGIVLIQFYFFSSQINKAVFKKYQEL